jgi:hypothetical protein
MPAIDFEDPRLQIIKQSELGGGTFGKVREGCAICCIRPEPGDLLSSSHVARA